MAGIGVDERGGVGSIPLGAGRCGELGGEVRRGGGALVCWQWLAGEASAGGGGGRGWASRSAAI